MRKLLSLRIPATSANLGPGFDCMGLALDLWNTFELYSDDRRTTMDDSVSNVVSASEPRRQSSPLQSGVVTSSGIEVESQGEGAEALPNDKSHLVVRTLVDEMTMRVPFDVRRVQYRIVCKNEVPVGSGLGSSSTATLAGLLFANALLDPDGFQSEAGQQRILARAFEIEGHGDNVAPALLGGLVIVASHNGHVLAPKIMLPPTKVVVCVPQFHFLTSHARSVLPGHYTRGDAVFNIGRALLVAEALRTSNYAMLAQVAEDRIHEPYRLPAVPGALQAKESALNAGACAVCLSGAGPGLIAFAQEKHTQIGEAMRRAFAEAGLSARYWVLDVTTHGAQVN